MFKKNQSERKEKKEKKEKSVKKFSFLKFDLHKVTKAGWIQIGIVCVCVVILIVFLVVNKNEEASVSYKETTVQYGSLMQGVTEEGSVDIGTVEQTFDLDMTALQRATTSSSSDSGSSSSSGSAPGGMSAAGGGGADMFSQIMSSLGGSTFTASGEDSTLTVASVEVTVGQQVAEGDVLYTIEEDTVSDLEEQLQSNVEKAKADLEAVYADQTLSKTQAQNTYDTSIAGGSYADTEYNSTIQSLADAVTEAQTTLTRAQELLATYQQQLEEANTGYAEAAQTLANCEYSRDAVDKTDDPYMYVYYCELVSQAESTANSLENTVEQLEDNIEQATKNVEQAQTNYNKAVREQAQGKITATQTRDLRKLAYDTAQETYDVALAYLEDTAEEQEEVYADAQEAWDDFSTTIQGNSVCATYNGVVTSVNLAEGDTISTGTALISLYDMDEVTMTVTVDEDDMTDIAVGSAAKISFTAYPDQLFDAAVSEIADAETDSSGNVTYDVTVTLSGDVSGLFQGMTGEITFVTDSVADVLYVSKRAVITDGDDSYLLVQDENGNIKRTKVTVGFSDGTYVEIQDGVSEGDTVLIESTTGGTSK